MKINKQNITAVILAGGRGSRLGGQDKGLVTYKKKALIEHVLERIEPQVGRVVINANRNREVYAQYGFPVIEDEISNFQGPLAGVSSVMKVAQTDYILILPCDGPIPPLDLVPRMLSKLEPCSKETIAVAHDGKRMQPVHALIPVILQEDLQTYLENGNRKTHQWYSSHELVQVDFSDSADAFFNINTKEQL